MENQRSISSSRRSFFTTAGVAASAAALAPIAGTAEVAPAADPIIRPPEGKRILLSVKLGMIPKKIKGEALTLTQRLSMAGDAGLDGVDFDQAGSHTAEEARAAVKASGVFVHNAINHAHWGKRLTSKDDATRAEGVKNIEHCIRVSHAAGGNGVLIVVGSGNDGTEEEAAARAEKEIRSMIPLAASLGQPILFENVWNKLFYDHDKPPEQSAARHVAFIDRFNSNWVGQYFDIGNHWKYGQPGEWMRELGHRCVKLDVKGFNRAAGKWSEIGEGDLPWDDVRKAIDEIGFAGWATAEVGGGDVARLTKVREQMERVFGL